MFWLKIFEYCARILIMLGGIIGVFSSCIPLNLKFIFFLFWGLSIMVIYYPHSFSNRWYWQFPDIRHNPFSCHAITLYGLLIACCIVIAYGTGCSLATACTITKNFFESA